MISSYKKTTSVLVALLFFGLIFFCFKPLFNSGDDVYLMYTLAGAFGEPPSNLLHYNHIWHPLLGSIIKTLFSWYPEVNWYTLFLAGLHFTGCTLIIYVLLCRIQKLYALIFSVLFLLVFESMFLMNLDFSSTSFLVALAACTALYQLAGNGFRNKPGVAMIFLLLCTAGMLRWHMTTLVLVLFLPLFVLCLKRKLWLTVGAFFGVLLFVLFILNQVQLSYYERHIHDWKKEEAFRQAFFYSANRPPRPIIGTVVFKDDVEHAFFNRMMYYDTSYIRTERLSQIDRAVVRVRNLNKEDLSILLNLFIEARLFIALLVVIYLLISFANQGVALLKAIPVLLCSFLLFSYLFLFQKITLDLFIGGFMVAYLQLLILLPESFYKTRFRVPLFILSTLFTIWAVKKIISVNKMNISKYNQFVCALSGIRQYPDKLFLATDDTFPLDYFYVWQVPGKFPAANLIYSRRLLTHTYQNTLKRFGITDLMKELPSRPDVLLVGQQFPELQQYYKQRYGIDISMQPLEQFDCPEVYQLVRP